MARLTRLYTCLAALLITHCAAAAAVRVALPPPPNSRTVDDPQIMLIAYLQERLGEAPDTILATPAWAAAELAAASPLRVRAPADGLLHLMQQKLPIDALLRPTDEGLELHLADGFQRWPWPENTAAIRAQAAAIAEALGLPEASRAILAEERYPEQGRFVVHYGLPSFYVPRPRTTAGAGLAVLGPVRQAHPDDAFVAARILENAAEVLALYRPYPDEAKTALALAPLALPTVLGTPHEAAALTLLHAHPEPFLPQLKALAAAPVDGEVSMDSLLGDALGDAAEPVPLTRKVGALRVLAQVDPETAAPLLQQARNSDLEPLRKAVLAFDTPPEAAAPVTPQLTSVQAPAVLAALAQPLAQAQIPDALRLCGTAYAPIAQAARQALAPHRPTAPEAAAHFDLQVTHPYVRRQLLRQRHDDTNFLAVATEHTDPYTRAEALRLLTTAAPATAREPLHAALDDPYLWVRLEAASLLADLPPPHDTQRLQAALEREDDPAVRALLQPLAGVEPTNPLPPARAVAERPNLRWLCGYGADAVDSPFDAYYVFVPEVTPLWRDAYAAGKIFVARVTPISNPGLLITDPQARDSYWLNLIRELPTETLRYLDGVVYGEESMNMHAEALWPSGWALFCHDSGLDPARVNGDFETLTEREREAWHYWARARCVEGFNQLAAFTRRYLGAIRPGFQVATFLPKEILLKDGTYPPDRELDFDIGGIYDYKGCNRLAAYWLVRRYRTLWPERPVMWLSLGLGGYEMNPVNHAHKPPALPLLSRRTRSYADTLSAWQAGAQAGWFSVWFLVDSSWTGGRPESGVIVGLEEVSNHATLRRGAAHVYRGIIEKRLNQEVAKEAPTAEDAMGANGNAARDLDFSLEEKADPRVRIGEQIEIEKAALISGMRLYQQYVYDCARVIGDLPPRPQPLPVLMVRDGISVWSRDGARPVVPGFGLYPSGDFVCDINHLPYLDLSRYQVIGIHDPARLRDTTITALTQWLRTTEGTLYIHRDLTADNSREMPTPSDLDGSLNADWPWESTMTITPQEPETHTDPQLGNVAIVATIHGGEPIATVNGKTVLAAWSHPDFRGRVIVDGLTKTDGRWLARLAEHLPLTGHPFIQAGQSGGLHIATSSRYYSEASSEHRLPGIDLLTGEHDPLVSPTSQGAVTATSWQGSHTIVHSGIGLLAERPIEAIELVPDGIILRGGGLIRVRSRQPLTVDLPELTEPFALILDPATTGRVSLPQNDHTHLLYLRAPTTTNLTIRKQ